MRSKLLDAIRRGDRAAVEALLDAGAPLEWSRWRGLVWRHEYTPLQAAIVAREPAIVELLLARGAAPDGGNPAHFPPLAAACIDGDLVAIELLVARGTAIDGPPEGKYPSPIGVAATRRNLVLVDWLIEHGADPSTAFTTNVAIDRSSLEVLTRLLDAGAKAPPDIERAVRAGKW